VIAKAFEFFGNVRGELDKVTWPAKKETYASTGVVIVLVILVAIFLWIVDLGISETVRYLLS
jgi:preprotein translocase subunit SecE